MSRAHTDAANVMNRLRQYQEAAEAKRSADQLDAICGLLRCFIFTQPKVEEGVALITLVYSTRNARFIQALQQHPDRTMDLFKVRLIESVRGLDDSLGLPEDFSENEAPTDRPAKPRM